MGRRSGHELTYLFVVCDPFGTMKLEYQDKGVRSQVVVLACLSLVSCSVARNDMRHKKTTTMRSVQFLTCMLFSRDFILLGIMGNSKDQLGFGFGWRRRESYKSWGWANWVK